MTAASVTTNVCSTSKDGDVVLSGARVLDSRNLPQTTYATATTSEVATLTGKVAPIADVWNSAPRPLDFDPSVYFRDDYLVLDFETTNHDKGSPVNPNNRLVLAVWKVGRLHPAYNRAPTEFERNLGGRERGCFAQAGSEYEQSRLLEDIRRASFVVAHNAKFELGWLRRCGVNLRDIIVYCTQIGEFVIAGNRRFEGGLSLDATLARYKLGHKMCYVSALIEQGVCPSQIPILQLTEYCTVDVSEGCRLFLRQRQRVGELGLDNVAYGRNLCTPMLADAEWRGIQVDKDAVHSKFGTSVREQHGLIQELEGEFGSINWNSSKQLGELLYDNLGFAEAKDFKGEPIRTPGGKPSTDDSTIGKLAAHNKPQRRFLALYKVLNPLKKRVEILDKLNRCCDADGGTIFAQFNQTVAQTHRLTSSGGKYAIQFQNIPRDFKALFRARNDGWVVLEGDCPQLEFRVGGELGHDRVAKEDVLGGVDIHKFSASILSCSRQDAKPHTFKPLYGGQSGTPRERAYYAAFRERYSGIYNTQMGWVYHVLQHKSLSTPTGLVFYWPDTQVTRSGYITNTPSIFNYPIQMFATADISQLSLLLVWHQMDGLSSFICNTVHDSGILECPPDEVDKVKNIMVDCYTDGIYNALADLYDYNFSMPLGIGIKVGDRWGAQIKGGKLEPANEEKFENRRRFEWRTAA